MANAEIAGTTGGGTAGKQIDVVAVIDAAPLGRSILLVVALCAGVSFLDGFDILAISYVALRSQWSTPGIKQTSSTPDRREP
ncbi:MAG: hypothetical protein JO000_15280 [Alphaproteobacteria bacterium]|nr:hypothetical protein [Alphaproteobacteria bacterium]